MVARFRLFQCQKLLSQSFQQSSEVSLGRLPAHLQKYSREYFREFRTHQKISRKNNILEEILGSQIVLCGDYHSLSQAQRTVIRILREILPRLKKEKKTLYLGLEALRVRDNIRVQQFLRNEISEAQFLKAVRFEEWGFNWINYAPLFYLAKEWGIQLIGLSPNNRSDSLELRDKFAGQILARWTEKNPEALIFALMGDFHLAQKHLPLELRKELKIRNLKKKILTIHQNSDSLFFKTVRKHHGNSIEVIQLKKGIFCILNTAPWIKAQSYLRWIDDFAEDPVESIHEEAQHFLEAILQFLAIKRPMEFSRDFQLKFGDLPKLLKELQKEKELSWSQINTLKLQLKDSRYLLLRSRSICFLSSSNLNHLSALCGQYVHLKLSGFKTPLGTPPKDFYQFLWGEALGYLGSKIVNPKRKCKGIYDFQNSFDFVEQQVFKHLQYEKDSHYGKKRQKLPQVFHYPVAKLLGKLLGQGIFDLVIQNKIAVTTLRGLFANPLQNAQELYLLWAKKLDAHHTREFSFRDKL